MCQFNRDRDGENMKREKRLKTAAIKSLKKKKKKGEKKKKKKKKTTHKDLQFRRLRKTEQFQKLTHKEFFFFLPFLLNYLKGQWCEFPSFGDKYFLSNVV